MTERDVVELLREHEGRGWTPWPPAPEADITALERALGRQLPRDYRSVLAVSNGGEIVGDQTRVLLFPTDELPEFNPDLERTPELADMLVFGSNMGDYLFYFDTNDRLGGGRRAVYGVEMGVGDLDNSIEVAGDMVELIRRTFAGEDVLAGPYLKDQGDPRE